MTFKLAAAASLLFMILGIPVQTASVPLAQNGDRSIAVEIDTPHRGGLPPDSPRFVAEPEDPSEVEFIADAEDPTVVCSVPLDGPIDVCERGEPLSRVIVPGYERVP